MLMSVLTTGYTPKQLQRQALLLQCAKAGAGKNFSTKGSRGETSTRPALEKAHPYQEALSRRLDSFSLSKRLLTILDQDGYVFVGDVSKTAGNIFGIGPKFTDELIGALSSQYFGPYSMTTTGWKRPVRNKN